jgi:hypothetical protein
MQKSPAQIKNMVLSRTFQHPLTVYPAATGVVGLFALGLFGMSAPVLAAIGAGFGVSAGSFFYQYLFRGDRLAAAYLEEMHRKMEERRDKLLRDLEGNLRQGSDDRNMGEYVDQALKQFHMIDERFRTFRELLDSKIERGELTHSRFFITGEQVYLAVLDNLQDISSRLQGVRAMDPHYINDRLEALAELVNPAQADADEMKTLTERRTLRERQLGRVNELLTFNEAALTKFDEVNAAVAGMRAATSQATLDIETATRELQDIAERANRLSVQGL